MRRVLPAVVSTAAMVVALPAPAVATGGGGDYVQVWSGPYASEPACEERRRAMEGRKPDIDPAPSCTYYQVGPPRAGGGNRGAGWYFIYYVSTA